MKLFNKVKTANVPKNAFDLSHERKFTCDMGELIPILVQEVVPGDEFYNNTEVLLRMAPLMAPVMARVDVYTHFFFVSWNSMWYNFDKFYTGSHNGKYLTPDQKELYKLPYFELNQANQALFFSTFCSPGSLGDYLGMGTFTGTIPGDSTETFKINAGPFIAYLMIWVEFYKDENLHGLLLDDLLESLFKMDGGEIGIDDWGFFASVLNRCWEKDYFTSALPWAQKGDPASAAINVDLTTSPGDSQNTAEFVWRKVSDDTVVTVPAGGAVTVNVNGQTMIDGNAVYADTSAYTDGSGLITVENLRWMTKLQQWLETCARAGTRLSEYIQAHFGANMPDQMHRPIYLGGGKNPIVISEVLQNSETGETPQGHMAGHGISIGNRNGFRHSFSEPGYIIGILSVLPRASYMNLGPDKMFLKTEQFDFYLPEFANLGEQPVQKMELYWDVTDPEDAKSEFGYQSRYSEYKFKHSTVHGDFRDSGNGLDAWHMARDFEDAPGLNSAFVEARPTKRIFAVTEEGVDSLYIQIFNNLKAVRPMPFFGTPQL